MSATTYAQLKDVTAVLIMAIETSSVATIIRAYNAYMTIAATLKIADPAQNSASQTLRILVARVIEAMPGERIRVLADYHMQIIELP